MQTFEVFAEVWAGEHDVSTAESMRAQEVGAQLNARFTVRYSEISARVDARFRILYNGKEYNITGVRNLGRNTWIEIDAVIRAESSEAFEVSSP